MTKEELETWKPCYHFFGHELFPKKTCLSMTKAQMLRLMDPRIFIIADFIRILVNQSCYVNNWFWKGHINFRGWRYFNASWKDRTGKVKYVSNTSQHCFGRAIDIVFSKRTIKSVIKQIITGSISFTSGTLLDFIEKYPQFKWRLRAMQDTDGLIKITNILLMLGLRRIESWKDAPTWLHLDLADVLDEDGESIKSELHVFRA